jgi:tetratricopeptide (TPR) repeat protein
VRLLITTRDPTLPHDAYRPSRTAARLQLGGLGPREAMALTGAVLDALGHARPPRPDLQRLLRFLGGHPLSIQLVTPHLQDYPDVATVIDRFEALYPGFTAGKARERNESLDVSLSFSLRRLSDGVQARLPSLGVFAGGALEMRILPITGLTPSAWAEVREELVRAGLLTVGMASPLGIETDGGPFSGHYVRFHPTLAPHLRRRLEEDERAALEARYRQHYYEFGRYLLHMDTREPHAARALAQRELPNLRRALDLTLAAGDIAMAVDFADNVERFLNVFGRWRERDALVRRVVAAAGEGALGSDEDGPLTEAAYLLQSRQGELLLDQGRAAEAEAVFRRLLTRMDAGAAYDTGYDRAQTLGRLGRSLRSQGRPAEAERAYRRELEVLDGLERQALPEDTGKAVRRQTGLAHTDLADVLTDQGRYAEAREHYENGLKIAQSQDDKRQEALVLGQLGMLALAEGDYAEAQASTLEALERFRALGETRSEAILWHQLGMVAQEAAQRNAVERAALLEEAENAYAESLRLKEAMGDKALAATSANQLAIVAQLAGRPADAERWYRRAIELKEKFSTPSDLASSLNNLAALLLTVHGQPPEARPSAFAGRDLLEEAETWARKAVKIDEAIGDPSLEIWKDYSVLAQITQARGDETAARDWRRKARAAYVAFPGHWARLQGQYGALVRAIAAAMQGEQKALDFLSTMYPQMEAGGSDWHAMPEAIRQLLTGARDLDEIADALALGGTQYLLLSKALEILEGGGVPAPSVPPAVQAMALLTLGVVACATGQTDGCPQVEEVLDGLAQQDDWAALAGALRRVLAGERARAALAPGLDEVDVQVLDLALGALAGDAEVRARLETLAQAAQREAQAGAVQQIERAFRAWLDTPAGQQAAQAVQAQGLPQNAAMQQLLRRFMEAQG